jgi:hypothetical protein
LGAAVYTRYYLELVVTEAKSALQKTKGTKTKGTKTKGTKTKGTKTTEVAIRLPADQSVAAGKAARVQASLESHSGFSRPKLRDPIRLLLDQAESRVPE